MASKLAHEDRKEAPEEKKEAPEDWRFNCSSQLAQMSYALEHGVMSDVSFLVGDQGEVIRGHRIILSIGSHVFQELLTTWKSFDENPIEIRGVQPNGFKLLLKYLYTGKIPKIPDEDYIEFFRAVKYFMVRRLYTFCKKNIIKKMTVGNALKVYEDGKDLEEKDLEDAADGFIKKNAQAILAEPKFLDLSLDNLVHFVSADDFSAEEILICQAVFKWGQAECDRQKLEKTPENVRSALKNIIPQIRFPLMDPEEFALQVVPLNLLSHEEHVALLTYFIIPQDKRDNLPRGSFISKPRIPVQAAKKNAVKVASDSLDKENIPVEKEVRVFTELQIGNSYTISNKGAPTNYLIPSYWDSGFTDIITKDLVLYEKGERHLSTRWVIGAGSEPNSYTLYSKSFNAYLMRVEIDAKMSSSAEQAQNWIFEYSQTPGYFLITCGSKRPNYVLSNGIIGHDFVPTFIKKPEIENDSILWRIKGVN